MGVCGLALLGLLAPVGQAGTTQQPEALFARRPEGISPPRVDGRLDDPAWEYATPLSDLRQGSFAPLSTEVEFKLGVTLRF